MGARVFDLAFALVYFRLLREEGTGAYQFLVVFTTYLDTLVDFGLNTLVARDVARAPGRAAGTFRAVAVLRLGLWLVGLPLVAIVYGPARATLNLPPAAAVAGWVFYLALLPSILAKSATALLWAFERLELTGYVSVLGTLLKTAFGVAALLAGAGLVGLAFSSVAVNIISAAVLLGLLTRVARPSAEPGDWRPHPRYLLRESWPLFLNQLLQGLFFKIDSLLLPGLAGTRAAGAYAAAYKVNEGLGTVSSSVTLALFPRLARQAEQSAQSLSAVYSLTVRVLLQVACPVAAATALLAQPIMALVGGSGFLPDSAIALAILIWYLPFSFVNGLTQYVLIADHRQRFLTLAFVAALVFNVGANLLVIPRFGYVGAAWVTVLSELVLLGPFAWAARRAAPGVSLLAEARAPVLATLLTVHVMWWLRDSLNPLAAVAAGALVYPAALWAVGGLDRRELTMLGSFLPAVLRRRLAT